MKCKIIVFTGIDGSGKTTQADLLNKYLRSYRHNSKLIQPFAPGIILRRILWLAVPHLKKAQMDISIQSESMNTITSKNTLIIRLLRSLALFNLVFSSFFCIWRGLLFNRAEVAIFDRYFYDNIIKAKWLYGLPDSMDMIFIWLIPRPYLIYHLDASSENAWKREIDGDTTLQQHIAKKNEYSRYFNSVKLLNYHYIDTNDGIGYAHRKIINIFKEMEENL